MPKQRILNPLAKKALMDMKMEIAKDMGFFNEKPHQDPYREYQKALAKKKYEVARELGIDLKKGYNGDLKSREAGRIGGYLGGPIGGEMVRRMVAMAKDRMLEK